MANNSSVKSWNFKFGLNGVTADTKFSEERGYGFLGIGSDGWLEDERSDGFRMQEGQEIVLQNTENAVAVTEPDMPIRFAVSVEPNTYYQVKVTLTGADPEQDAKITLFSEKRHIHLTEKLIPAGEELVYEFNVNIQNVHSKKTGVYLDKMLNIVVLGENAALAAVKIQQLKGGKTLWILGDSTVCDQTAALPYFPLSSFGGVGQALPKYLGKDLAVSNHGESGLQTISSKPHFENFKERIQPGDLVYFEFGHNHKEENGVNNFYNNIPHYYEYIRSKGAKLIIVGPIDRHRPEQYDPKTNSWSSTLREFSEMGRKFVEEQVAAGRTDIAFVDLNAPSLKWYEELCEKYGRQDTSPSYYFHSIQGGEIDRTHPNDTGVDHFAYFFVENAKAVLEADPDSPQAKVLAELLEGARDEQPNPVSDAIVALGAPPNAAYPKAE